MRIHKNMDSERYLKLRARLDDELRKRLTHSSSSLEKLYNAMAYGVFEPGKCLRPMLAYSACEAMGGQLDAADGVACAVELMHAYSLIHDDLPALDDALVRRGKPALHLAYGESTALIAGDALQALAFESLAQQSGVSAGIQLQMVAVMARAAGPSGLAGGQFLDMALAGARPTLEQVAEMQRLKTGALIEASVVLGAMASGAAVETNRFVALRKYAEQIGRAFQVCDDILDIVGDRVVLGKAVHADQHADKSTAVSSLGLEGAQHYARQLLLGALTALDVFGPEADTLRKLAYVVVERDL
ncbi:polyprenyl synthetase family protein [Pseudomonas laurylsulfatiphila]|uniref:polyprenyl synthetase family protein n=1 Tax=Pseudomonas laurylsulfatiphila TaxID=2011015 RepID=UPI002160E88C|nr:farnesyl diphosphate synthase [Pseudomonas laurylsulfatiphila]UVM07399.1 polyprenyl synthetase family protein [Pseudomonas laurylsulfatiphila]